MITREQITAKFKEKLEPLDYIYALWLEGSDANGTADEYSDIDLWIDVKDEFEEKSYKAVEDALLELGKIDSIDITKTKKDHPTLRQRVYHLKDSSEYLLIDFNWQLHSRDRNEYCYIKGSRIEASVVLFDRDNVIRYVDYDPAKYAEWNKARLDESIYRYGQHSRVIKYVRRGLYLEAYAYYNRYVFEPLIDLLRVIYTPAFADYYLVHISQHIPEEDRVRLEYFARIPSIDDIERKISEAEIWFKDLLNRLQSQENHYRI